MPTSLRTLACLAAGAGFAFAYVPAKASSLTYITGFSKDNNIYTNLNQEFPNTGPGVPGSGVGTPNASFIYNPYSYSPGTDLAGNDGASFDLTSNGAGQDFAQFGSAGFGLGPSITANIGVNGVSTVYALMSSYNGDGFSATFTGQNGATQTFSGFLPDFNGGSAVNTCSNGICLQTAFQVTDVGAGGSGNSANGDYNTYDLTEVTFTLDSALADQMLSSATFSSTGFEGLLLGLSVAGSGTPVPEPGTAALLAAPVMMLGLLRRRGNKPAIG